MTRHVVRYLLLASLLLAPGCNPSANGPPAVRLTSARDSVEGAVLHYQLGGAGPPLLLLHGFMWSAAAWEQFADTLGRHYSLIIPDLPGHGHSTGLPATWSTKRAAQQMYQLLDRLKVERVRAIGCSAGANVLLHMALIAPERIEAMVLVSGSHRLTDDVRQGLRTMPSLEELPKVWRDWNARHSPNGEGQERALLQRLRLLADNTEDFSIPLVDLGKIRARTLIATGDQDTGPSIDTELELQRSIPGSSLWVVPNAGHCPFWGDMPTGSRTAEAVFSRVVLDFLAPAGGR